jgi:hypothetical protein
MGVVSATPILALGGGLATPKNGLSHPQIFFFLLFIYI